MKKPSALLLSLLLVAPLAHAESASPPSDNELRELVEQLDDANASTRRAAEQRFEQLTLTQAQFDDLREAARVPFSFAAIGLNRALPKIAERCNLWDLQRLSEFAREKFEADDFDVREAASRELAEKLPLHMLPELADLARGKAMPESQQRLWAVGRKIFLEKIYPRTQEAQSKRGTIGISLQEVWGDTSNEIQIMGCSPYILPPAPPGYASSLDTGDALLAVEDQHGYQLRLTRTESIIAADSFLNSLSEGETVTLTLRRKESGLVTKVQITAIFSSQEPGESDPRALRAWANFANGRVPLPFDLIKEQP